MGTFDRKKPGVDSDRSPLRGLLDFESINDTAESAGGPLKNILGSIANLFGLTGILQIIGLNPSDLWGSVTNVFIKPLGFFAELVGGFLAGGVIPILDPTKILNLPGLFTSFTAGFAGIFEGVFGAGTSTATTPAAAVAEAKVAITSLNGQVTQLIGGGVLTQYTVNGTWTKPTVSPTTGVAYKPADLFTIVCVCGGDGGAMGAAGGYDTAKGGISGGYVARRVKYSDLPATAAMIIGAAGAGATASGPGGSGGVTSFGSLVTGAKGRGGEFREDGSYAVVTPPGDGGDGAFVSSTTGISGPSSAGGSSAFAAGGRAGNASELNGQTGSSAPAGVPSGGGGGGGGSASSAGSGLGGAGGYPGGGGGGGGLLGGTVSAGTMAAAGEIFVIAPY